MRYGPSPSNALELLALALGKAPRPVLDTLLAPLQARALIAAVRLGVIDALAEGESDAAALAGKCAVDADCLSLLLRLLCAMGYVAQERSSYRLTRMGRRHFGKEASDPYSEYVRFGDVQWRLIAALDQVLQTGQGLDFHTQQGAEDWALYQRAMLENARGFARFVVEHVPVPTGASRCLDLGGAHGLIGAELCKKSPGLTSTVLDRAEALSEAQALAHQHGYGHWVRFQAGDMLQDALPPEQDLVLLCNVVHHFSEAQNLALLQRVRAALRGPSSVVVLFDIEAPEQDAAPDAAGDGLALYFRLTSSSRCVRGEQYASWLEQSGFRTRIVRSLQLPARVLILGFPI